MKIVRVLVYEGDEKWINETLGSSIGNGVNIVSPGRTITSMIVRPEDTQVCAIEVKKLLTQINKALDWESFQKLMPGRLIS